MFCFENITIIFPGDIIVESHHSNIPSLRLCFFTHRLCFFVHFLLQILSPEEKSELLLVIKHLLNVCQTAGTPREKRLQVSTTFQYVPQHRGEMGESGGNPENTSTMYPPPWGFRIWRLIEAPATLCKGKLTVSKNVRKETL